MQPLLLVATLVVGLLAGALVAWLAARARVSAQIEAAVGRSEGGLQGELAQLRERVVQADQNRQAAQIVYDALKVSVQRRHLEIWRSDADDGVHQRTRWTPCKRQSGVRGANTRSS